VHYYLSDHLGSTSIVASATGAVEEESDYYPFGTEVVVIGPGINELKFTGKRRDTESQLDYFGARYYSNMLGRWATPDWAAKPAAVPYAVLGDPQSLNLYTYVRNIPTTGIDPDGHCDSKFCQIAVGVFKGTGKFLWNNSPGGQAIDGIRQSIQDMKAGPAAAQARAQGQLKAAGTMVAAVTGNPVAQAQVVGAAVNSWNSMSTTDKTSTVTQGVLTIATIWIAGKIPAPGPSMVGFNEAETGMLNQSLKNLSGAGYDTRAFQQLVKSTDMPAATCAMCLSTPPTGAALGDGAFASQEMLDHTMEEELRHLGQDLSNQWIGRGDAAAKEAEVNANRKFPEPKQ
jgi:RHS repeat-associated protein